MMYALIILLVGGIVSKIIDNKNKPLDLTQELSKDIEEINPEKDVPILQPIIPINNIDETIIKPTINEDKKLKELDIMEIETNVKNTEKTQITFNPEIVIKKDIIPNKIKPKIDLTLKQKIQELKNHYENKLIIKETYKFSLLFQIQHKSNEEPCILSVIELNPSTNEIIGDITSEITHNLLLYQIDCFEDTYISRYMILNFKRKRLLQFYYVLEEKEDL